MNLTRFATCFAATVALASCAPQAPTTSGSASGGSDASGGSSSSGGASGSGGNVSGTGGKVSSSGGSGDSTSSGGKIGSGGSGSSTGGSGTSTGGSGTSTGGSGTSTGGSGTASSGGMMGSSSGGATSTGGMMATVDMGGKPIAKAGDSATASKSYLNLGDMRLINNRWGSDALNCGGTNQKVYVTSDGQLAWDFTRPTCGGMKGDPDFPEVEFGVAPFGNTSSLLTTPAFSSTTVLPIQIKDLQSATANIDSFNISFSNPTYWDNNFEFWISKQNPLTNADAGVYAEIIAFVGWQGNRLDKNGGWPCDKSGSVTAGGTSYNLCHQSDSWGSGSKWRFFNFNVNNGPMSNFSSKVDIKALLDWVSKNYSGFTSDMWLTRIEVGTEVDDNTSGTAKIKNLTFEINGASKGITLMK